MIRVNAPRTAVNLCSLGPDRETASGSFQLRAAPEGNRGAVFLNDPVDLACDASFAFDVRLNYCGCEDGVTFLLHTNGHGEGAPAEVIESGGLQLEIGALGEGGHDHAGEHDHAAGQDQAGGDHEHDGAVADGGTDDTPDHAVNWQLNKAAKQVLAEDAWHQIKVFWDASEQSFSYTINGDFAGKLTGDVVAAFLDGKTSATFGFVGAELPNSEGCHEVRLIGAEQGGLASSIRRGDSGDNRIGGGEGDDLLFGARGADVLRGFGGADDLRPGRGADRMQGGAGADEFVFCTVREAGRGDRSDVILDFETGVDLINLSAIDADRTASGNQAFRWLGEERFGGDPGSLCFEDGRLLGDVDGDQRADFIIGLESVPALPVTDILL